MGRLTQLFCRHDYVATEHVSDRYESGYDVGDRRIEVYELRCTRCGKTRRVAQAGKTPIGTGDTSLRDSMRLPR
jgi:hypothetical protein